MTIILIDMLNIIKKRINYYIELTKPGISRFQIITVSIGYLLAKQSISFDTTFIFLIISTYCFAACAGAGNNILEQHLDKQMPRTKNRVLPSTLISKKEAIVIALTYFFIGMFFVVKINPLTTFLCLTTIIVYLFIYTPLKQISWLNTLVGAIPGALPILGGWVATATPINLAIISVFFALFCWQIPHFYALSIMYYDDYKVANYKMLPLEDPKFIQTKRQIIIYSILMILSSLYAYLSGYLSMIYLIGILILSIVFFSLVFRFLSDFSKKNARHLFILSIIYLPVWFIIISIDIFYQSNLYRLN